MRLVLFDLDNTLLSGDSDFEWAQFLIEQRRARPRSVRGAQPGVLRSIQGRHAGYPRVPGLSAEAAVAPSADASWMSGTTQFMREKILPIVTQKARELVAEPSREADLVAIITATNSFVTDADRQRVRRRAPDRDGAGTDGGEFTGKVAGTPSFREGKITRLEAWLAQRGVDWDSCARELVLQRFPERSAAAGTGQQPGGGGPRSYPEGACRTAGLAGDQPAMSA